MRDYCLDCLDLGFDELRGVTFFVAQAVAGLTGVKFRECPCRVMAESRVGLQSGKYDVQKNES